MPPSFRRRSGGDHRQHGAGRGRRAFAHHQGKVWEACGVGFGDRVAVAVDHHGAAMVLPDRQARALVGRDDQGVRQEADDAGVLHPADGLDPLAQLLEIDPQDRGVANQRRLGEDVAGRVVGQALHPHRAQSETHDGELALDPPAGVLRQGLGASPHGQRADEAHEQQAGGDQGGLGRVQPHGGCAVQLGGLIAGTGGGATAAALAPLPSPYLWDDASSTIQRTRSR